MSLCVMEWKDGMSIGKGLVCMVSLDTLPLHVGDASLSRDLNT